MQFPRAKKANNDPGSSDHENRHSTARTPTQLRVAYSLARATRVGNETETNFQLGANCVENFHSVLGADSLVAHCRFVKDEVFADGDNIVGSPCMKQTQDALLQFEIDWASYRAAYPPHFSSAERILGSYFGSLLVNSVCFPAAVLCPFQHLQSVITRLRGVYCEMCVVACFLRL